MEIDNPIVATNAISHKTTVLPELEILCYLLVLVFLIDQKQFKEVIIGYLGKCWNELLRIAIIKSFVCRVKNVLLQLSTV